MIQINLTTKQKETHRLKRTNLCLPGGGVRGWGEEIDREFGMDMYKLLHLKWIMSKDMAHETLFNVVWQPGWEGSLGKNGYMYVYS